MVLGSFLQPPLTESFDPTAQALQQQLQLLVQKEDLADVSAEGSQGLEAEEDLPSLDGLAEGQTITPQDLEVQFATPNGSDDEGDSLAQYFALMEGKDSSGETFPHAACPFII